MCLVANTAVLGPFMSLGYSAVALPALGSSELRITISQASWIASSAAIATPVGCVLSSLAMKRGRKTSLIVLSAVSTIGWAVIYFAANFEQIVAGRILTGISSGLASVPATVYAAEVTTPKLRSIVVTWTSVGIALAVLIVYVLGYVFQDDWRAIALACGVFPVASVLLVVPIMPESPIWLRDSGHFDDACKVLARFRGVPADRPIPAELLAELKTNERPARTRESSKLPRLPKRNALCSFGVMLGYFFFQQFSGIFVVVFYAVEIAREVGITIDAYLAAILIGLTRLVGSVLMSYASRKFGRRIPSIGSGVGMTVFMGGLALYVHLASRCYRIDDGGAIPIVCIVMYIFTSTMGFLVVPFAMMGEIYPADSKDVLTGLTTCAGYVFSFVTIKVYPDMLAIMGAPGVFLFYAVFSFLGTVFVYFLLPETKGKTLLEIEGLFEKKKNKKKKKKRKGEERSAIEMADLLEVKEKAPVIVVTNGDAPA